MAPRLKPLSKDEELNAVPTDQPVLVLLEPPASGQEDGQFEEPEVQKPEPEQIEAPEKTDGAKILQDQLDAAKRAREQAEQQLRDERAARQKAEREAEEARIRSVSSESDAIASGLAGAEAEMKAARASLRQAVENGDIDAQADAQARIGRVAADIRDLERAQALATDRREQETARHQQRSTAPAQPASVEEAIDAMPHLLPAERTWLKAHPDAYMDPGRNDELKGAYSKATRKGLIRGTDQYFQFLETELGYAQPAEPASTEGSPSVSAPVSRDTRSSTTGQPSGNRIMLAPEQREFARTMGLSDVQYAQQVAALHADKKANPERYGAR